ncbi:MAG: HAD family phosphatase [Clostridia bacterium]|nr:HAD family phosphatase [Clostridia bacterium]
MNFTKDFDAVIFDMDGTLLDSMWAWRGENRFFLERNGLPIPEDLKDTIDVMSSHALARRVAKENPGRFTFDSVIDQYIESMSVHYETDVFPKKGAKAFLEKLKAAGIKMCVATATPREIAKKALEFHGLLEYFEFVTDDSESGVTKSKVEYYPIVTKRLGTAPERTVMFEDSLYAMRAAKAAGLTPFGIEERVHLGNSELMNDLKETASIFVKDFDEASEILFG